MNIQNKTLNASADHTLLYLFFYDNKKHHLPHIHASFGDDDAIFSIEEGKILEGTLPRNKQKLAQAWMEWKQNFPEMITEVRGLGLLLAVEFRDEKTATHITDACLAKGLFVRQTQGNMIRIFPALNIKREELEEGLAIFKKAVEICQEEKERRA